MRAVPVLIALAGTLGGCASLGGAPLAVHGVSLAPDAVTASSSRASWQLLVDEPRAVEPVAGARVVVVAPDGEYTVLPGVRWRENAPALLRSLLLEAFDACACVAGAGPASAVLRGDYRLAADLRHFELRDDGRGAPVATIDASLSLVRIADGRVVATRRFTRDVPAARRDTAAGLAALRAAINAVVADAVPWVRATGDLPRAERRRD